MGEPLSYKHAYIFIGFHVLAVFVALAQVIKEKKITDIGMNLA